MSVGDYLEIDKKLLRLAAAARGHQGPALKAYTASELLHLVRGPQDRHPLFSRWPGWLGPQLATSLWELSPRRRAAIEASGGLADAKVEGFRAVFHFKDGRLRVFGRHHDPQTWLPFEYTQNLEVCGQSFDNLGGSEYLLDVEIEVQAEKTRVGLAYCQTRLEAGKNLLYGPPEPARAWQVANPGRVVFHVFDCLVTVGVDITRDSVDHRKAEAWSALDRLADNQFKAVPFVVGDFQDWVAASERWMADGYEGGVGKPFPYGYGYEGSRGGSRWVKFKKSADWRAVHDLGVQEIDAWVNCVRADGTLGMNMLVESADGQARAFPCFVGNALPFVDGAGHPVTPALRSVWRVDAAYFDTKTMAFRYLRLVEPRADKTQAECRVAWDFLTNLALRVNNF